MMCMTLFCATLRRVSVRTTVPLIGSNRRTEAVTYLVALVLLTPFALLHLLLVCCALHIVNIQTNSTLSTVPSCFGVGAPFIISTMVTGTTLHFLPFVAEQIFIGKNVRADPIRIPVVSGIAVLAYSVFVGVNFWLLFLFIVYVIGIYSCVCYHHHKY